MRRTAGGACTSAIAGLTGMLGRTNCSAANTTIPTTNSLANILIESVQNKFAQQQSRLLALRAVLSPRRCNRSLRSRPHQRAVLREHARWIARLRRLPLRHALSQYFVADFNFEYALTNVEVNHVAIANRADRAAQGRFWRDMACHQTAGRAAETAIGQQSHRTAQ